MDTVTPNTTTSYNIDEENRFKISKNSGHGTTHKIRDALNFTDSKKWKKFSSRRLQLIDHFGLSERKASEQDDNIKQIADILRNEFEYPLESLSDFEKLVTAAVQSVRRNRKRSKKKTLSRINTITNDTSNKEVNNNTTNSSYTLIVSKNPPTERPNNSKNKIASLLIGNPITSSSNLSSSSSSEDESIMDSSNNSNLQTASSSSSSISHSNLKRSLIHQHSHSNTFILPKQEQKRVKLSSPSSATTSPDINIHEPIRSMLRALIGIPLSLSKQHLINTDNDIKIPFHLKQNLLNNIQNSKSLLSTIDLYEIENSQQFTNLESLGQTSIRASLSLVVEKYFTMTLKGSLLDMLRVKSTSQDYIDKITQDLFDDIIIGTLRQNGYPTILSNNTLQISSINKIKTFNLIIGSIVKDYGFDSVLSPLNDIIQTLVNLEYQELQKAQQKATYPITSTTTPVNNNLNGLNMLSSVSLQLTDDKHPTVSNVLKSPSNEVTTIKTEKLPSVALFDDIIKRISVKNEGSTTTTTTNTIATTTQQPPNIAQNHQFTFLPKPNVSLKSSFENGNLPQPIHQF